MIRSTFSVLFLLTFVAAAPAQTPEQKKATIKDVKELQTPDGGFQPQAVDARLDQPLKGSLRATTTALRALKYFGGMANDKAAAAKFVQKCFDATTGGFTDAPGGTPDVFSTAVGLMAVAELKLPAKDYENAAGFLSAKSKEFEDVRIAAAGLEALWAAGSRTPIPLNWLLRLPAANADGTYGKGAEIARMTAGVVVTRLRLGASVDNAQQIIGILNRSQKQDGGFGKDEAAGSDLETTYRVMRCYHMLKAKPAKAEALRDFIAKCRNGDGGYGVAPGKPSQVGGTYFAGIILHWLAE